MGTLAARESGNVFFLNLVFGWEVGIKAEQAQLPHSAL